ncbi:hypothetical protein IU459_29380 [Nocardia amamiensis]|uniref:Uncharacterized protein n=1 Tax=Nocardia amamiensis TaxID=404578 RepID=A0ABS0CYF0_9NOCA|nr:DUF6069 family protein [Nocardia amamiensis]MBF6301621.1 hypothetical protein [Nocardia amamiensis]
MTISSTRQASPSLLRYASAIGGAVLVTALLWAASQSLGVELRVYTRNGQPAQVVGLPLALGSTLVVSLLASATRKWLDRFTDRASTVWTRLAVTVLLVSLAPMAYVQASGSAKATLALMHLAVAAVLVPLLASGSGARPGTQQHA